MWRDEHGSASHLRVRYGQHCGHRHQFWKAVRRAGEQLDTLFR